jgi:hypothetical protein
LRAPARSRQRTTGGATAWDMGTAPFVQKSK